MQLDRQLPDQGRTIRPTFLAECKVGGVRNRLVFDNRCDMSHPVHLHRHTFEITNYAGKATTGVFKDVVMVPKRSIVEVDLMATSPGPSLFHCHQQFHMDFGFMAVMQY